ncbi:hypothetical protein HPP92_001653 [Vanilla planifolia]|uniref:Uncharacterized protein n=1 Tax=Vanilla planifolia TaxID=51239 RepID=A0A835VM14_VANPL|nr:hypothetical protein HPP92_001653 [Vanilla planifolia]
MDVRRSVNGAKNRSSFLCEPLRQNPPLQNFDHTSLSSSKTTAEGDSSGHGSPKGVKILPRVPTTMASNPSGSELELEFEPVLDPTSFAFLLTLRSWIRFRRARRKSPAGIRTAAKMNRLARPQGQQQHIAAHSAVFPPAISAKRAVGFVGSFWSIIRPIAGGAVAFVV